MPSSLLDREQWWAWLSVPRALPTLLSSDTMHTPSWSLCGVSNQHRPLWNLYTSFQFIQSSLHSVAFYCSLQETLKEVVIVIDSPLQSSICSFSVKLLHQSISQRSPSPEGSSQHKEEGAGRMQPRGSQPLGCDMLVFCHQPGVTSNQTVALKYQSLQVAYFQKMNLVGLPAPTCIHCLQKCKEEGQSWVLGTASTGSLCHSPGGDVVRNGDLSKVPQCQNQHQNQALIPQSRLYFQLHESLSPLGTSTLHSQVSPETWFQQVGPGPNQVSMSPLTLSAHTSRKAACSTNNCCQGLPEAPKLFTATHT